MARRIEEYILYGMCRRLETLFKLDNKSVKVRTRDEAYDVFVQKHDRAPKYPFAYLTFTNGTINDTMHRPDATAREGLRSRLLNTAVADSGLATVHSVAIVPYTFTLTFNYVTQDYNDVLTFNARNAFVRTKSKLDFNLVFKNVEYTIDSETSKDVSIPLKSKLGLDAGAFELEVEITVNGYVSSADIDEDDYTTPVIKDVNVDVYMQSDLPPEGTAKDTPDSQFTVSQPPADTTTT
ncbi:hypothetical protein GR11A_00077 [Vibrio phage vB_VcorM_GR11A]|nr:hypothetical protein GR11A_00077 [Vibrio phage vB_VcorM_GR11A]